LRAAFSNALLKKDQAGNLWLLKNEPDGPSIGPLFAVITAFTALSKGKDLFPDSLFDTLINRLKGPRP